MKTTFALLFAAMLACGMPVRAWAMLAPAAIPMLPEAPGATDRAADLKAVQSALESKIVKHRLQELGLTEKEIETRLARLDDTQLHRLATEMRSLDAAGGDTTLAGALVVVALVLFIIYLLNRI